MVLGAHEQSERRLHGQLAETMRAQREERVRQMLQLWGMTRVNVGRLVLAGWKEMVQGQQMVRLQGECAEREQAQQTHYEQAERALRGELHQERQQEIELQRQARLRLAVHAWGVQEAQMRKLIWVEWHAVIQRIVSGRKRMLERRHRGVLRKVFMEWRSVRTWHKQKDTRQAATLQLWGQQTQQLTMMVLLHWKTAVTTKEKHTNPPRNTSPLQDNFVFLAFSRVYKRQP